MKYRIKYSCVSHIGNVRQSNQDSILVGNTFMQGGKNATLPVLSGTLGVEEPVLFGVFDGMGGLSNGEKASLIAAKGASELKFSKHVINDLRRYCSEINREICDCADELGGGEMGTTASMLAFSQQGITLCHIGDSRIFRLGENRVEQISRDHTVMYPGCKKPLLTQNLGIRPEELQLEPYFSEGSYQKGDRYLICSDGLTDMVFQERICEVLRLPFEDVVHVLLNEALAAGGRDNISIILCQIERGHWLNWRKTSGSNGE